MPSNKRRFETKQTPRALIRVNAVLQLRGACSTLHYTFQIAEENLANTVPFPVNQVPVV